MEIKTYYYRRYIRVESTTPNLQTRLEELFQQGTTFVNCPVRFRHDAYETPAIRRICALRTKEETRHVMEIGQNSSSEFLGRVRVRLRATVKGVIKIKVLTLLFARMETSVDRVCSEIIQLNTIQLAGQQWTVERCFGGGEKVRFTAESTQQASGTGSSQRRARDTTLAPSLDPLGAPLDSFFEAQARLSLSSDAPVDRQPEQLAKQPTKTDAED
jgi:RNA-binding protein YhbY